MAPRRRRQRRRRAPASAVLDFEFSFASAVTPGVKNSESTSFKDFAIDVSRPCRVLSITMEIVAASGGICAAELYILGPPITTNSTTSVVRRSKAIAIGMTPRRCSLNIPPNTDFWTPVGSSPMFGVDFQSAVASSGEADRKVHVVCSGTVRVQFQRRSVLFEVSAK